MDHAQREKKIKRKKGGGHSSCISCRERVRWIVSLTLRVPQPSTIHENALSISANAKVRPFRDFFFFDNIPKRLGKILREKNIHFNPFVDTVLLKSDILYLRTDKKRKSNFPHIWGNIFAFPHILGSPSSYMTLKLLHSQFPYI